LLDNAVKFTTKGLVVVTISLTLEEITIQIRDMGQGVDSEIGERLFEKFVTKSEGGTGLGLYVTKKIVEAHGGKIWATNNQDGAGSTFGFALPRNANQETYSTTEPVINLRIGDLEQSRSVRVIDDPK
jgi:signal transduction histidine kinase